MGGTLPIQTSPIAIMNTVTAECPICLMPYDSDLVIPKMTKCGHTACSQCLEKLKSDLGSICSICKSLDPESIKNLPTNYAILQINETQLKSTMCITHGLEYGCYCKKDNKLLCWNCADEHINHKCIPLNSSKADRIIEKISNKFIIEQEFLLKKIEDVEKNKSELQKCMQEVEKCLEDHINELNKARDGLIEKINTATNECIKKAEKQSRKSKILLAEQSMQAVINEINIEYHKIMEQKEKYEKSPKEKKLLVSKMKTSKRKRWLLPSVTKFSHVPDEFKGMKNHSDDILCEFEKLLNQEVTL
ncbi:unnamed protein product [Blepharisma stoltei]|uniref:RING-type domain-containing protein n=1 Tax=Blepharisma stoltei TaxID=1481888 RepID=A0AAU9K0D3_9CILI|nr:unnamed protein product [Blepharisma stoltei]